MNIKVGILTDSRKSPFYQDELLTRLLSSFNACGVTADLIDFKNDIPVAGNYAAFYPLPVFPSAKFAAFLHSLKSSGQINKLMISPQIQVCTIDKTATIKLLSSAFVPIPNTIITSDIHKAYCFIGEYKMVIIKSMIQVAGLGHYVAEEKDKEIYLWVQNIKRHRQIGLDKNNSDNREVMPSGYKLKLAPIKKDHTSDNMEAQDSAFYIRPPFFIQKLVKCAGKDSFLDRVLRVYFVGQQPVFGSYRTLHRPEENNPLSSIINYAWGGEYELLSLSQIPSSGLEISKSAERAINLNCGAIDLISDYDNNWYVLEAETDNFLYHICRRFYLSGGLRDCYNYDFMMAKNIISTIRSGSFYNSSTENFQFDGIEELLKLLSGKYILNSSEERYGGN